MRRQRNCRADTCKEVPAAAQGASSCAAAAGAGMRGADLFTSHTHPSKALEKYFPS